MEELDLNKIRQEIDSIDRELVRLFEKRMDTVIKVAKYKEKNNQPVLDKSREILVIDKAKSFLEDTNYEKPIEEFFENLMAISRKLQARLIFSENRSPENDNEEKKINEIEELKESKTTPNLENKDITVCFQGVPGAFSEQALIDYFGKDTKRINVNEFEDVFKALKDNENLDYGILPIENSSTGGVSEVCDLLRKYGLFIVGEKSIKIEQNLLAIKGTKLEDVKEVYSHSQGLQQSSEYLKANPNWTLIPFRNTAESAKLVKEMGDKSKAAITSRRAAELYDLEILASGINHNNNNHTRFIIIGKSLEINDDSNKISIVFSAPHKPGALYSALSYFTENNLNMQRIESRPTLDKSWEYFFYIDFEGNLNNENVKYVVEKIKENSTYFKLLGNYKKTI